MSATATSPGDLRNRSLQLNHQEQGTAVLEGLGAIENSLTSEIGDLQFELQNLSGCIKTGSSAESVNLT
jgi:hypothetical protein